ncbi:30S ribosomal protein S2 [bacterium]|nr:30S ribosomal protein S2 [bacterium]
MVASLKSMMEAGVHFGHQTGRWNPKMRPYIFDDRNGIHIINLDRTVQLFERAAQAAAETASRGGQVLFIGTKKAAAKEIRKQADRCGMPYVNNRWPGGLLTNFQTVKHSVAKLKKLDEMHEKNEWGPATKKEILQYEKMREKLEKSFGGIKIMSRLPELMFIIDPNKEHIAAREGKTLDIPIIGIVDTNCDPDGIDYVVPGNDDAIRSISLFSSAIADAVLEGLQVFEKRVRQEPSAAGGDEPAVFMRPISTRRVEDVIEEQPVAGVDVQVRHRLVDEADDESGGADE